jgi:Transglycosylase SLT domain
MKISHVVFTVTVLTVLPTFAQQRNRLFDNFDTARGVEVQQPSFVPMPAKSKPAATSTKLAPGKKLVKKTGKSSMSVGEGLAEREMPRAEYNRLVMGTASHMKGFTTGDLLIDSYIVTSSRKYNIDPLLIYAQMHQESSFKLRALSHKGASGLMQLMPATARRLGVTNIYDPRQNIEGGVKYMRMLLDMFGQDVRLALAGYNAGEGAVMKYGNNIPPYNETREYVRRISARYGSISNPYVASGLPRINDKVIAKLVNNETKPLSIEQNAVAIKLPDGRMRLVNQ